MRKLLGLAAVFVVLALPRTATAATIGLVPDDGCIAGPLGVLFCDADIRPTGTGVFNPFLRTNPGGGLDPSSGWNTGENKKDWDIPNDADDPWTSALDATTLGTTGGYVIFTVDINQQGQPEDASSLLSLSHFQLFSCTDPDYNDLSSPTCTSILNLFGGTVTYDANGRPIISDALSVDFNYRNHTGSGSGDIDVLVPASFFTFTGFIALLDGWGTPGQYPDNDGFQEWRAGLGERETCPDGSPPGPGGECDVVVAEPVSLMLFGMVALGSAYRMRRRGPQGPR